MGFRLANVRGRAALVRGEDVHDLEALSGGRLGPDPMEAIAHGDALHELDGRLDDHEPTAALAAGWLGPPVPRPRHCFGIGLNYLAHAREGGMEAPETPVVFTKFPGCIVGPDAEIELRSEAADYEAELVVVIGTPGRDIATDDAWDHVAGLMVGQDVSDRALQFAANPPHFDLGKSRDTYGPTGPWVTSPDLVPDRNDLPITCDVNGERRQDASTSELIFDVPALIAHLSSVLTLSPGDLIFTGTPEGVGLGRGVFLAPGDVITTTIEGLGTLTNHCR